MLEGILSSRKNWIFIKHFSDIDRGDTNTMYKMGAEKRTMTQNGVFSFLLISFLESFANGIFTILYSSVYVATSTNSSSNQLLINTKLLCLYSSSLRVFGAFPVRKRWLCTLEQRKSYAQNFVFLGCGFPSSACFRFFFSKR